MEDFCTLINRDLFKKLRRSILLTALVVLGVNMAQAQAITDLSGTGTENDPYIIGSTTNWNTFADYVNANKDNNLNGKYVELRDNIEVNVNNTNTSDRMVGRGKDGNENRYFSGTFKGNFYTITFKAGTNETAYEHTNKEPAALFRVIDGATIQDLNVVGTIRTKNVYNAGLVGYSFKAKTSRSNKIKNCIVSVNIDCSQVDNGSAADYKQWDCSVAGFACENKSGGIIEFENCIFDGSIDKKDNAYANRGAGFVSFNAGSAESIIYKHCLMMGLINLNDTLKGINGGPVSTFSRKGNVVFLNGCHYGPEYGEVPQTNSTRVLTTEPEDIHRRDTVDGVPYFILVDIYPQLKDMICPELPLSITLDYYGRQLIPDSLPNGDYKILIRKRNATTGVYDTVPSINDEDGLYKVKIEGIPAKGYYGSKEYSFRFISEEEKWVNLRKKVRELTKRRDTIVLDNDYIGTLSDTALIIADSLLFDTLIIDLNGHTLDRGLIEPVANGQVIRIAAGKTVVIKNGTIKGAYSRAQNDKTDGDEHADINDAGGIFNMGNLVLNNVNVEDNICVKQTDSHNNDKATARGGGVYNGSGSSFTMTGGKVSHNQARGGGGGVYCFNPTSFSMTNVEISYNDSESKGGGLRIRTAATADTARLVNCRIENNRATDTVEGRSSEGGGIFMQEGKLKMVNCTIGGAEGKGNQSAFAGAGFYQNGGYTVAKNCTISYNSAYTQHDKMYGGYVLNPEHISWIAEVLPITTAIVMAVACIFTAELISK